MIYIVSDLKGSITYFVPDEATQLDGQSNDTNGVYVIGTIDDANAKLREVAQSYLNERANDFSVCISLTDENGTSWQAVDLNTEIHTDNATYYLFDPVLGMHEVAVGLVEAKSKSEQIKQNFLSWSGLSEVQTLEALPRRKVKSTGTQSL